MTIPALTFSAGSTSAPTGTAAPTAREVKAMGQIAMGIGRGGRTTLMNQICGVLNMPPGGWSISGTGARTACSPSERESSRCVSTGRHGSKSTPGRSPSGEVAESICSTWRLSTPRGRFRRSLRSERRWPSSDCPDHTWNKPAQPDREKLVQLGQLGPPVKLPAGCYRAGWFWLGKKKGFTDCHDGRSFVVDERDVVTEKGKLPKECMRAIDALTSDGVDLYASCGGKVFRTSAAGWRLYSVVRGEKELTSVSFADGCVFVTGRRSVYRSCASR